MSELDTLIAYGEWLDNQRLLQPPLFCGDNRSLEELARDFLDWREGL